MLDCLSTAAVVAVAVDMIIKFRTKFWLSSEKKPSVTTGHFCLFAAAAVCCHTHSQTKNRQSSFWHLPTISSQFSALFRQIFFSVCAHWSKEPKLSGLSVDRSLFRHCLMIQLSSYSSSSSSEICKKSKLQLRVGKRVQWNKREWRVMSPIFWGMIYYLPCVMIVGCFCCCCYANAYNCYDESVMPRHHVSHSMLFCKRESHHNGNWGSWEQGSSVFLFYWRYWPMIRRRRTMDKLEHSAIRSLLDWFVKKFVLFSKNENGIMAGNVDD